MSIYDLELRLTSWQLSAWLRLLLGRLLLMTLHRVLNILNNLRWLAFFTWMYSSSYWKRLHQWYVVLSIPGLYKVTEWTEWTKKWSEIQPLCSICTAHLLIYSQIEQFFTCLNLLCHYFREPEKDEYPGRPSLRHHPSYPVLPHTISLHIRPRWCLLLGISCTAPQRTVYLYTPDRAAALLAHKSNPYPQEQWFCRTPWLEKTCYLRQLSIAMPQHHIYTTL